MNLLLLLQPAALRRIMGKLERSNQRKQPSRDFENVFPSPTLRILLLLQLQFFFCISLNPPQVSVESFPPIK